MHLRNTDYSFGTIAILIHWIAALVIVGLFALGVYMTDLTYYDSWYQTAPYLHEGIGALLFLLMVVRLIWRWTNPAPRPEPGQAWWEMAAASLVHALLYLLIFTIMISGYLISTADGRALGVFEWFAIPATLYDIEGQADFAGEIHLYLAYGLMALASLHSLAALKHHFIDKDRTLVRMLNSKGKPS